MRPLTARAAGFRMPAEWTPHECCWMAWPAATVVWGDGLQRAQQGYADVANAIAAFEPVRMLTPAHCVTQARSLCGSGVEVIPWELDDAWLRDIGPNFVVNERGQVAASVFQFNAWGQKYPYWRRDAALGHQLAEAQGMRSFTSPLFLEGGALCVDGEGTLLTTEQCVLHDNRNPGLDRDEAERLLCEALGVDTVIWLAGDLLDNETDGHVDGIACFVRPGVVLHEPDPSVPRDTEAWEMLQENRRRLDQATDSAGRQLDVHSIDTAFAADIVNDRFCHSYVNFYIANGGVVMPAYGIEQDAVAQDIIAGLFPDREVVAVDVNDIAPGGGGIHCITQQQPRGTA